MSDEELEDVIDNVVDDLLKKHRANVVVCFCHGDAVRKLLAALYKRGQHENFTLIGSDGWNTRSDVVRKQEEAAQGSFSVKLSSPTYEPFTEHYVKLKPASNPDNIWFQEFWEQHFNCTLDMSMSADSSRKKCTGIEDLETELQLDGKIGFVVDALYTMANGLHNMINDLCPETKDMCDAMKPLNSTKYYEYMIQSKFTTYSNKSLSFDKNGDPPGKYEIMNYQLLNSTAKKHYDYVPVATWENGNLVVSEDLIQWKRNQKPEAVCSYKCKFDEAKQQQADSKCCWICTKCDRNEIPTETEGCKACDKGHWPSENRTECLQLEIQSIKWADMEAILPLCMVAFGLVLGSLVLYIFIKNHDTAIVKASTRELTYMILAGLLIAYLSTISFIVKPTRGSCYISRIIPGVSFTMVYGSILTKTNRIARILARGKKKIITRKPRCMTTGSLVFLTVMFVLVECGIILASIIWQPPNPEILYSDSNTEKKLPQLRCKESKFGILGPLSFVFFLIALCTFYAIKTRNVPANFNEAKFIGFSMYVTCVIWIAFVPLYFGSESKVITITMCIILSSTVTLVLLFIPKVYIMVRHPEKNNRGAFTTTKEVRCHVGRKMSHNAGRKYSLHDVFCDLPLPGEGTFPAMIRKHKQTEECPGQTLATISENESSTPINERRSIGCQTIAKIRKRQHLDMTDVLEASPQDTIITSKGKSARKRWSLIKHSLSEQPQTQDYNIFPSFNTVKSNSEESLALSSFEGPTFHTVSDLKVCGVGNNDNSAFQFELDSLLAPPSPQSTANRHSISQAIPNTDDNLLTSIVDPQQPSSPEGFRSHSCTYLNNNMNLDRQSSLKQRVNIFTLLGPHNIPPDDKPKPCGLSHESCTNNASLSILSLDTCGDPFDNSNVLDNYTSWEDDEELESSSDENSKLLDREEEQILGLQRILTRNGIRLDMSDIQSSDL